MEVESIASLIGVMALLAGGGTFVYCLGQAVAVSQTRATSLHQNSDEEAREDFLKMVGETKSELVIYDDGDADADSVYQSRDVVDALRRRLDEYPELRVRYAFNHPTGETLFEELAETHPHIEAKTWTGGDQRRHYKLSDRRKAYVSHHGRGSKDRYCRTIDCTAVTAFGLPWPLKPFYIDFKRHAAA